MKRIQKFAAASVMAVIMGAGSPVMAAQDRSNVYNDRGAQHQSVDPRRTGQSNNNRSDDQRWNRDGRYRNDRGYGYAPVYESAPIYAGPVYDNYYTASHEGRTAAIIAGSAAADHR
jgi:hypothetical protein